MACPTGGFRLRLRCLLVSEGVGLYPIFSSLEGGVDSDALTLGILSSGFLATPVRIEDFAFENGN